MLMPSTPTPQPHSALGNLLDDDDDYVIIDGPSPFNSTHGSLCALPTPPRFGQRLCVYFLLSLALVFY